MILQPILENAFKYAYESGNGDPMRLELGYEIRSDRDFDIIIENSGEISDETLQSLNEKLQSTHQQYIHLAWQFLHVNYRENGISGFWHNFLHFLSPLTDVFHHLHFL